MVTQATADRFWSRVRKTEGCWEWQGCRHHRSGYGHIRVAERLLQTHRLAFEIAFGPIPDGVYVCHKCDVPFCVRPDHLFLGTQTENMADMVAKGRGYNPIAERQRARTHCPAGHAYDDANTYVTRKGKRSCRACNTARMRATRNVGTRAYRELPRIGVSEGVA